MDPIKQAPALNAMNSILFWNEQIERSVQRKTARIGQS